MGLRRFFLRNDGSNILTYRSGRSYLGVIPFVATLTADSRVVVFQAGVSKNDISVERKPMTFRLFMGRSRLEVLASYSGNSSGGAALANAGQNVDSQEEALP